MVKFNKEAMLNEIEDRTFDDLYPNMWWLEDAFTKCYTDFYECSFEGLSDAIYCHGIGRDDVHEIVNAILDCDYLFFCVGSNWVELIEDTEELFDKLSKTVESMTDAMLTFHFPYDKFPEYYAVSKRRMTLEEFDAYCEKYTGYAEGFVKRNADCLGFNNYDNIGRIVCQGDEKNCEVVNILKPLVERDEVYFAYRFKSYVGYDSCKNGFNASAFMIYRQMTDEDLKEEDEVWL